jgi:hypothetical protein
MAGRGVFKLVHSLDSSLGASSSMVHVHGHGFRARILQIVLNTRDSEIFCLRLLHTR